MEFKNIKGHILGATTVSDLSKVGVVQEDTSQKYTPVKAKFIIINKKYDNKENWNEPFQEKRS